MGSHAAEREFERKAKHDMELARKKLKGFSLPTAPNVRNEEACEFFQSAARRFRIASKWQDSAECYAKCADLQARMGGMTPTEIAKGMGLFTVANYLSPGCLGPTEGPWI